VTKKLTETENTADKRKQSAPFWFCKKTHIKYDGWSKISVTELIVGKRKHLQVTLSYLLLSTTLQIVCSDSSDPSTFQCMSGRLVWEWPATAVSYLVVSQRRLEIVSPSGCSSAWGRGRSRTGPNLVSKAGGEPRGRCCLILCEKPGNKFCRHAFRSKILPQYRLAYAKLSSSAISLIVKRQFPRITALTRSTVSLVRAVDGRPVCGSSSMDVRPFLSLEYHSNVLDRLNAVSSNACCSISYVSVAVLPSFWQNLMQTRCSFNTSISQYDGGTNTIAL
jgi:hypothetical protein